MALRDPAILDRTLAPDERRVLVDFAARVRGVYGARLMHFVVFGSRARGDADEDSDIDVMVVLDVSEGDEAVAVDRVWELLRASKRACRAAAVPLAPIVLCAQRLSALRDGRSRLTRDLDAEGIAL